MDEIIQMHIKQLMMSRVEESQLGTLWLVNIKTRGESSVVGPFDFCAVGLKKILRRQYGFTEDEVKNLFFSIDRKGTITIAGRYCGDDCIKSFKYELPHSFFVKASKPKITIPTPLPKEKKISYPPPPYEPGYRKYIPPTTPCSKDVFEPPSHDSGFGFRVVRVKKN